MSNLDQLIAAVGQGFAGVNTLEQHGWWFRCPCCPRWEDTTGLPAAMVHRILTEDSPTAAWARANLSERRYSLFIRADGDVFCKECFSEKRAVLAALQPPPALTPVQRDPGAVRAIDQILNRRPA